MALTRKMLAAMGLTEEQVSSIIEAHTEVVDALKGYKADAEKLAAVQQELDALKATDGGYEAKYSALKKEFDDYKADTEAKATAAEKAALYRAALKAAGVDERRFDAILRLADLSGLTVKDGKLVDEQAVIDSIKSEWGDYIPTTETRGTRVENPPKTEGAGMTREQILAIKDASARQRAIAENLDQFK